MITPGSPNPPSRPKPSFPPYVSGGGVTRPKTGGPRIGMDGFDQQGAFDFAVGSVRGYRWWKLAPPDTTRAFDVWPVQLLYGANGYHWVPGWNEAHCSYSSEHEPPVELDDSGRVCGCGFWAYWTVTEHNIGAAMPILGVIEGTGRTLIGLKGFRCQRARIAALYIPFDLHPAPSFTQWRQTPVGARLTEGGARTFKSITGRDAAGMTIQAASTPPRKTPLTDDEAIAYAGAWMGVIQDRLQQMYPDAEVFATKAAFLAKYPPIGAPESGEGP